MVVALLCREADLAIAIKIGVQKVERNLLSAGGVRRGGRGLPDCALLTLDGNVARDVVAHWD